MSKIWEQILNWIGFQVEEVDEGQDGPSPELVHHRIKKDNVINLNHARPVQVVVVRPQSYEEVQGLADHLKGRRPVIVNLEETERTAAKRLVDFLSGTVYALNGKIQRIGPNIFLAVPSNFEVTGAIDRDMASEDAIWHRQIDL